MKIFNYDISNMEFLQWLIDIDESMFLAINNIHSPFFNHFMYLFSGKIIWIPMYTAVLYIMLRNFSLRTTLFCLICLALTIVIADQFGASVIRPLVGRLRPSNLDNPISEFVHIVNNHRSGHYGFPSCHAANSFGLAFFILFLFRNRPLTIFFLSWAVVTSYSRIYLGLHYPGDLLAGMLLGLFAAWVMYKIFLKISNYQRPTALHQYYIPIIIGSITILSIIFYSIYIH